MKNPQPERKEGIMNMKKLRILLLYAMVLSLLLTVLSGCEQKTLLDPDAPVTLTMWHVYGEQADSPMNRLIEEFNRTVGREKGIIINVSLLSSTAQIGEKLLAAQREEAGSVAMPDLFFCHNNNAMELGADNLLNWQEVFSKAELADYVPSFVEDGMVEGQLSVFPISKSTHLLFIAGTQFDRFSAETGVTYDDLATWEGFFGAAETYYTWSGGKPFCALDYPIRMVELYALEKGATALYTDEGWYDFEEPLLREGWEVLADALVKGHVIVSDLYSNTQVMTGEVMCGLGSSASILYYNDTVTYPDNTSEPMDLQVLPPPTAADTDPLVTQAGVGLCAYKTTEQKAEAAAVFARWLTEGERNLAFCVETGYMPVSKDAFAAIEDYSFTSTAYKNLYTALKTVHDTATAVREPAFAGYYTRIYALYDALREQQKHYPDRYSAGENATELVLETWELFRNVQ